MLGRPTERSASPRAARLDLGFRRVIAVRAWIGPRTTRFEVDGVVHRHPAVTGGMAATLVAAGVPLVVRTADRVELLGPANWWLPRWLDRILPHMEIE